MTAERKCRQCGCTQNNACVTAAGPCHWLEPDLCSACGPRLITLPPDLPLAAQQMMTALNEMRDQVIANMRKDFEALHKSLDERQLYQKAHEIRLAYAEPLNQISGQMAKVVSLYPPRLLVPKDWPGLDQMVEHKPGEILT